MKRLCSLFSSKDSYKAINQQTNSIVQLELEEIDEKKYKEYEEEYSKYSNNFLNVSEWKTGIATKCTPLMFVASGSSNELDKMKYFYNKNPEQINYQNTIGTTALMISCACNRPELVKFLLEYGADPNLIDEKGRTAMIWAFGEDKFDRMEDSVDKMIKLLMEYGADPTIGKSHNGKNIFDLVTEKEYSDCAKLIIQRYDTSYLKNPLENIKIYEKYYSPPEKIHELKTGNAMLITPLMNAVNKNDKDAVLFLCQTCPVHINKQNSAGTTALMIACYNENKNIIKILLKNRANPNLIDNSGRSAINLFLGKRDYQMSEEKAVQIVELLLQYNADPNIGKNTDGDTSLIISCYRKYYSITKMLLDHKANPNDKNREGNTPLMVACHNSKNGDMKEFVNLLLKYGADPELKDAKGKTALQIIMDNENDYSGEIAKLLLDNGASLKNTRMGYIYHIIDERFNEFKRELLEQ